MPSKITGKLRRIAAVPCATLCVWTLASSIAAGSDAPVPMEPNGPAAGSPQGDGITPSVLLDDLDSTARAKQARMERLRRQLLQLGEASRRAAEARATPTVPEPTEPDPPVVAPDVVNPSFVDDAHAVPPPADIDPHSSEPATDEHAHPDHAGSEASPHGDEHGAHGHATTEVHTPSESENTEALTGARINRLALADSLFATGQSDLALQAYSNIELIKLPAAERYWIEYQIANCHRRLGNKPEAEQRYRRLAGLVDGGWCATHAKWWLDALATKAQLERDLGQIKLTLHAIEEQLDAKPAQ